MAENRGSVLPGRIALKLFISLDLMDFNRFTSINIFDRTSGARFPYLRDVDSVLPGLKIRTSGALLIRKQDVSKRNRMEHDVTSTNIDEISLKSPKQKSENLKQAKASSEAKKQGETLAQTRLRWLRNGP
jgi:hypothetical protein